MKLLRRYTQINIVTAILVLLICSVSYYFIIRYILLQQIDRDLQVEEMEIIDYVNKNGRLPNESTYKGQMIRFDQAEAKTVIRHFLSTEYKETASHENEPIRQLVFPVKVGSTVYMAMVMKSQAETEDLVKLIFIFTAGVFFFLLFFLAMFHRFLLGKLWQPFYDTLEKLRSFNVNNAQAFALNESKVDEFNQLNRSVTEMAQRVSQEFDTLRNFTDNASHEMQTPLAIINAKLDLLIQHAGERQVKPLQAIYDATSRLNRLNQTLLLLIKIDNQLFHQQQKVNFMELLQKKFVQLEELIQAKEIQLVQQLHPTEVIMNPDLAEMLINNLLNNAIKHNYQGGKIECVLEAHSLRISNTGRPLNFDEDKVFERFQKGSHSDGTGLGMAVVKQICTTAQIDISYQNYKNQHVVELAFRHT